MSFIRKIKKPSGIYLAEVENYRKEGKVKQKVIQYLGKEVEGKLVRKVDINNISVTKVRQYLNVTAIDKISKELGINTLLGKKGKPLLILIYSHLLKRVSISKIPKWLLQTEILDILQMKEVTSKQLYESLDYMNELDFGKIEKNISNKWQNYEKDKNLIVLDITDTYFNGSRADWKSRRGKDGKYDKLIQLALAVSFKHGFPLFHKIYEGNINNVKIFQDMISDIRAKGYRGIIIDRGMYSNDNINQISELELQSIVGVRLTGKFERQYIEKINREEIFCKSAQVVLKNTNVYVRGFEYQEGRLLAIYNPTLEVKKRERHYHMGLSEEKTKYFGYSLIYHNTPFDDKEVVRKYFEKDIVEKCFRQLKDKLSLRPLRVWRLEHIEAHIKVCYLSFCIMSLLGYKVKSLNISSGEALEKLNTAYKVHLEDLSNNYKFEKVVTLENIQKNILKELDVVYKN